MPRRKFKYESGGVVEVTSEAVRPLCDELTESVAPFKEDWLGRGKSKHGIAKWPIYPEAAGVDFEDIPWYQEKARKHGFTLNFDKHGRPELTDPAHMKKFCRTFDYYHMNAGYGDAEPVKYNSDYSPKNHRKNIHALRERIREEIAAIESTL